VIVGGDFNDWGEKLDPVFGQQGLIRAHMPARGTGGAAPSQALGKPLSTFPSRVPVFALDRFYTRGLRCVGAKVPRGLSWARLSDHLPLVAEFENH
jgi:endonuclease/exonuclease/phosphatase family metal-dependent hydrolase